MYVHKNKFKYLYIFRTLVSYMGCQSGWVSNFRKTQGADIRIILHRMLENPIRGQRPHDPFFSAPRKILFGPSDPHDLMITSSKNTELTSDRFFGTRRARARTTQEVVRTVD